MFRLLESELEAWKNQKEPKPLLIRGARQVGKSYLVNSFAKKHFKNFLSINFEKEQNLIELFAGNFDMKMILSKIALLKNQSFDIENTLVFFDEIQECPRAITSLRYIYEDLPGLHCIAAGSLLEFSLEQQKINIPVGRIQYLYMQPMSFYEFLLAQNSANLIEYIQNLDLQNFDDDIHQLLLQQFRLYMFIGGMPEAVSSYIQKADLQQVLDIQSSILDTYRDDFQKYASKAEQRLLQKVFNRAASLLGQKFKYSKIDPEIKSEQIKNAYELLLKARIFKKVRKSSAHATPLRLNASDKHFKTIFLDVGLMHNLLNISKQVIENEKLENLASGALAEQIVGQELLAYANPKQDPELFYWERDGRNISAEVDYLFEFDAAAFALEVKAGLRGKLKSLYSIMEEYNQDISLCCSSEQISLKNKILKVPLYAVAELPRLVSALKQ